MEIKQKYHKSRCQAKPAELPLLGAYNTTGFIFHLKKYCFVSTARYVQRDSKLPKVLWFIPAPAPASLFSVDNVPDKWFIFSQLQQCHKECLRNFLPEESMQGSKITNLDRFLLEDITTYVNTGKRNTTNK